MNKKLSKVISTLVIAAMLIIGLQVIGQVITLKVRAQPPAPSMYLEPSTETFSTNTASVGTLFNVTGWVNTTETYGFGWSAALFFNSSQLQVVKGTFSGSGGTESEWFQNSSIPSTGGFVGVPAYWNNTDGTIGEPNGFGETAYPPYFATSNLGSLFTIEFNITQAPPTGGSVSSVIQLDPGWSYPEDTNGAAEGGISYGNCTYTFSSSVSTTQLVTFAQTGLDSSASGTVVIVNGTAETYNQLPYSISANTGDTLVFSYQTNVSSSVSGKQFVNTGVNATSPLTVSANETVTGSYKTQYQSVQWTLTVVSAHDSPSPSAGDHLYVNGSSVTCNVTGSVVEGGVNYTCTGWTGTGSVAASGSGVSTTFTITQNSTITWNWVMTQSKLRVTFDQSGVGSDFVGTIVIIDGTNYNGSQLPISFAWTKGSLHTFAYQSPLVPSANTKYIWASTAGLTNLQSGSITVTTDGSIIGNYKTQYYLTVSSAYDSPSPISGWFDSGMGINESVTSPVSGPSDTQYICTGWLGSGGVPSSGSGTSVYFTLSQPSSIMWNWKMHPVPPLLPLWLALAFTMGLGLLSASVLLVLLEIDWIIKRRKRART